MKSVVTFGEILLRLKAPGYERLFQSHNFEATFGGSEANVAALLSLLGQKSAFVSAVPDTAVGDGVISDLRTLGVDASFIKKMKGRLGLYFLESGADCRPSTVIYDREDSCISKAAFDVFDWNEIFSDASWLHVSGISPALSQTACDTTFAAMDKASELGITVSMDMNYRSKLWQYGKSAQDVLKLMVQKTDVLIANEEHIRLCLGITVPGYDVTKEGLPDVYFKELSMAVAEKYPKIKHLALTRRRTYSTESNDFSALAYDVKTGKFEVSPIYHIEHIVDRVGAGDAFSGGFIYGLLNLDGLKAAVDFGAACGCLKHSIPGDIALLTLKDVEQVLKNGTSGRIQR